MIYSTVLVTGCGGDIGLGVGRLLKASGLAGRVIGCDIHDDHPGRILFDGAEVVERADSAGYEGRMADVIRAHGVELVVPTSEPELRALCASDRLDEMAGVPMLTASRLAMEVGFDKLATAEFLKGRGLPYPWTSVVGEGPPQGQPCIIKKRRGSGSRDVAVVEEGLVSYFTAKRPDDIWQERLLPDDREYTCGLYRSNGGETRSIVMRRRLVGGFTGFGEVVRDGEIESLLESVADGLELRGSINVQLRLTDRGPVVFEINPRFSSTVVFRHMLGFHDLAWSLMEKAGRPIGPYTPPPAGARFFRGSAEYILDPLS